MARRLVIPWVAAGGAVGAVARYEIARAVHIAKDSFPWATFWINVSGSLLLGVLVTLIVRRFHETPYARPLLAVGFLGAYTTFSTLAVEADLLIKDGHAGLALVYVLSSVVVGFTATWIGILAAKRVRQADSVL